VAVVIFLGSLLGDVLLGHHVAAGSELGKLSEAIAWSLLFGASAYIGYLGLEPYVRRLWPEVLVAWSRLLAGRFRDPRVGRDLLVGGIAFALIMVLNGIERFVERWTTGAPLESRARTQLEAFKSAAAVLGMLARLLAGETVIIAIAFLLLALVLRVVLRKQWAVMTAFLAQGALIGALARPEARILGAWETSMIWGILAFVLLRFGLLATISMFGVVVIVEHVLPALLPLSSWHAYAGMIGLSVILAIMGHAFWISLAGRPIFRGSILPE
jgi:hypothetical protein